MSKRVNNIKGKSGRNRAGSRIKKRAISQAVRKELRAKARANQAKLEAARPKPVHTSKPPEKKGFFRNLFSGRGK